jgi:hypothetical protein
MICANRTTLQVSDPTITGSGREKLVWRQILYFCIDFTYMYFILNGPCTSTLDSITCCITSSYGCYICYHPVTKLQAVRV